MIISLIKRLFFKKEKVKIESTVIKKNSISVALIITHKMRRELTDLGYNKFQINDLTPEQANDIITKQVGPHKG